MKRKIQKESLVFKIIESELVALNEEITCHRR